MILLAHAELGGLICSGRVAGGEHTYALMDERVPAPRRLGRTEALAELALRYFTGHGPATERDLAYWATLTLTDVRTPRTRETAAGMALIDAQLLAAVRRTITSNHVRFDLRPYRALTSPETEALNQAARRYGEFLRLKGEVTLS